jgi:hypothetical protein
MSPTFKIGDTVICIDNTGAPKSYKIGQKYTVRKLTRDIMSGKYVIGTYETEGSMYEFRFTSGYRLIGLGELNTE